MPTTSSFFFSPSRTAHYRSSKLSFLSLFPFFSNFESTPIPSRVLLHEKGLVKGVSGISGEVSYIGFTSPCWRRNVWRSNWDKSRRDKRWISIGNVWIAWKEIPARNRRLKMHERCTGGYFKIWKINVYAIIII